MNTDDFDDEDEYPMKKIPEATPERVKKHREKAGLTQTLAAQLVHLNSYQRWCEYENGHRNIDLARWELFLLKTGQLELQIIRADITE